VRLIAQIIRIRANFSCYLVKKIRLGNAFEFSSQLFNEYCMSIEIDIEQPTSHVDTQNGLV
jgi:hypothetical protein